MLHTNKLNALLEKYFACGGFLRALNSFAPPARIPESVFETYLRWVEGDVIRLERDPAIAKQLVAGINKKLGSQVSVHTLAKDTEVATRPTVREYLFYLKEMFVLNVFLKWREGVAFPRGNKKVYPLDSFVFHASNKWVGRNLTLPV